MKWRVFGPSSEPKAVEPLDLIVCGHCQHAIHRTAGRTIPTSGFGGTIKMTYCPDCAPPYDEVFMWSHGEILYYRKMRVSKDGEPVGYVKAPEETK